MGRRAKSPKGKAEAKRPRARKSPKTDGARVRDLEKRLAEALEQLQTRNRELAESREQQTATSEILCVISQSPTDAQPVFDIIAEHAMRLCGADIGLVEKYDGGELISLVAVHGLDEAGVDAVWRGFPMAIDSETAAARAVRSRAVAHIPDVLADPVYLNKDIARAMRYQSALAVPMLRDGQVIGVIFVARAKSGRFSEKQIMLLQTFADQAVIAIENVRLFKELEARNAELTDTLARQVATGEVLRVISRAQTDAQPVFNTIATSARRLCGASYGQVQLYDGELIRLAALDNVDPQAAEAIRRAYPLRVGESSLGGRVIARRAVVQIPDLLEDAAYRYKNVWEPSGLRNLLGVPMLRDGDPIGTITVGRAEPGLFFDNQIELLQTFAAQAVIAIENVRLFKELEARNRDLTTTLDQQTATAEILRVISSSPTDVQPVFDTISRSATRLCGAVSGAVVRFDGELIHLVADHNLGGDEFDVVRSAFPIPPGRGSATARAILSGAIAHVEDLLQDPEYAIAHPGFRTILSVPMLREGLPIGAITVARREVAPFSADQIELLKTFARQAVIAIENVRLFTELQEKNSAVTEALEQQTATAEILQTLSRTQADPQPVFETIVRNAVRLCGAVYGHLYRFDGELFHFVAQDKHPPEDLEQWRRTFPRRLSEGGGLRQVVLTGSVVNLADVTADSSILTPAAREALQIWNVASALFVPMLRRTDVIGVIFVAHRNVGAFSTTHVGLLKTFADQAVIAIENARLLTELQARTKALTRSVDELTALGEVSRAVSSTLDLPTVLSTIVSRAVQLSGLDGGAIYEYDDATEEFTLRVTENMGEEVAALQRSIRPRKGEGAVGRLADTRSPIEIADITAPGAYDSRVRGALLQAGTRALLAVPLLREDRLIGGIVVSRRAPGPFPPDVVALLRTFATQSALAIQNARLFREIEEKSRELEAASRHKSEFLSNMSHELRTPLNAIIGFSEVLGERMFGELTEKQEEYLQDIMESGRHLLSLINDILDLSKIEAGRMELEPTDFDLPSAIENALILVRERASRRGITLGRVIDDRLGAIRADERKVKQVLLNLLSNALKFTPEGGRVDVTARLINRAVEISVTDTGIGIAPEDQEAVFEEFRQVGGADKKVEGTGLGLALSRKFIELHGGRIWVKSEVGAGSTFTFTLPLRRLRADQKGEGLTLQ